MGERREEGEVGREEEGGGMYEKREVEWVRRSGEEEMNGERKSRQVWGDREGAN